MLDMTYTDIPSCENVIRRSWFCVRAKYWMATVTVSTFLFSIIWLLVELHGLPDERSFVALEASKSHIVSGGQDRARVAIWPQLIRDSPQDVLSLASSFERWGEYGVAAALYQMAVRRHKHVLREETSDEAALYSNKFFYVANYRASWCFQMINDTANAIQHAESAYFALARREPYYFLAQYLERSQQNGVDDAMRFYRLAAEAPLPPPDDGHRDMRLPSPLPSLDVDVYSIDIDKEIIWPHTFSSSYLAELSKQQSVLDDEDLADDAREKTRDQMVSTMAKPLLENAKEVFRKEGKFQDGTEFYYSTPTLVRRRMAAGGSKLLVICRLINYRLDPVDRHYRDFLPPGDPGHIMKSALALHRGVHDTLGEFVKVSDGAFSRSHTSFMGTEDPKLIELPDGRLWLSMTSWEYPDVAGPGARMASGILHVENATLEVNHAFPSPYDRGWEKNWVMFNAPGGQGQRRGRDTKGQQASRSLVPHFIYEWHPLRIGTMVDEQRHLIDFNITIQTPRSFRFLRGSSNGVLFKGQVWFMVHGVAKDYNYYHLFAVLDAETFEVVQFSYPFKLEGNRPTEFCLGIDIDGNTNTMTIAYSVMDGSSVLREMPMWKLERLMVKN